MSLRAFLFNRPAAASSKKTPQSSKKDTGNGKGRDEARKRRNFGRIGSLQNVRSKPAPPSPDANAPRLQRSKTSNEAYGAPTRRTHERSSPLRPSAEEPYPGGDEAPEVCNDAIVMSADRLDKLLDTLTQRELQLSMRIDRADEAVAAARTGLRECPRGTPGHEAVRRRALNAARKRRTLENSLAVTTQQSDCVLRAMGARGYVSVEDRLETRVVESRIEAEEATQEAEQVAAGFMATFGGQIGPQEEDQIAKEVEEHLHTPPPSSVDWVAEAHAKAMRAGRTGREDRAQDHIDPRMQNMESMVPDVVDGTGRRSRHGTGGEPRVSTERPRTSMDRIRAKIPNGRSFSRKKRSEKHR